MPTVYSNFLSSLSTSDIENNILHFVENDKYGSFIFLLPTNRKIIDFNNKIIRRCSKKSLPSLNIFTLESLFKKIFSHVFKDYFYIEGEYIFAFIEEAIKSLSVKKQLEFFQANDHQLPYNTFEKVSKLIIEFKENGVYPENLENDFTAINPKEISKFKDIIKIYRKYNEILENNICDNGTIFTKVNETFISPFHNDIYYNIFPQNEFIFIDGFSEFSEPEINLINSLISLNDKKFLIRFDFEEENPSIFGIIQNNIAKLNIQHFQKISFSENTQNLQFVNHNKNFLFKNKTNFSDKNKADFSHQVAVFGSKTRLDECEMICKLIKNIILTNPNIQLSKICIATFQTDNYTEIFRELFTKYSIPSNISDRFFLSNSPLISSIVALLQTVLNNFRKSDLIKAVSNPYFDFISDKGYKIDVFNLFNIANNLKFKFGFRNYLDKIDHNIDFLTKQIKDCEVDEEFTFNSQIKVLTKAKKDLVYLNDLLSPFKSNLTPQQFVHNLKHLLKKLNINNKLLSKNILLEDQLIIEKDVRSLYKFYSILDDLESIYNIKGEKDSKFSLEYYLDKIKTLIKNSRYNIKQKSKDGIFVTAAEETRGIEFDYMFFAGLVEGEFPKTLEMEIFKSEIRRKSEETHLLENRFLFYQVIINFQKHLYLSYPSFDNDKELIPSSFIKSLSNIMIFEKLDSDIFENIYSYFDLQKFLGSNIKNILILDKYQELSGKIERGIRIEKSREKEHIYNEYEGNLGSFISELDRAKLSQFKTKEYSISELETYGKCPTQYFFQRILKLKIFKEEFEDLSPLELGSLVHEILFSFFLTLQNTKHNFQIIYDQYKIKELYDLILKIAFEKIDQINYNNPYFHLDLEKLTGNDSNRKGLLKKFIDFEFSQKKLEYFNNIKFQPSFFEVSFGKKVGSKKSIDPRLSFSKPVQVGNINMRGKIDRIDLIEIENKIYFYVVDYKTGKYPTIKEIIDGTSLQIPSYLIVSSIILESLLNKSNISVGGIYYILKTLNLKAEDWIKPTLFNNEYINTSKRGEVITDSDLREIIFKTKEFINSYVNKICEANFNLPFSDDNIKSVCKYCDFLKICRIKAVHINFD